MKRWYASVNYGLEAVIGDIIKSRGGQNVKALDSAVTFSYEKELNLNCFNNLFLILATFRSGSVNEAVERVSSLAFKPPGLDGKTFRLVVMDSGKLRPVPQNIMLAAEKNCSRRTKLAVCRARPDIEIWLNRRNDGTAYFMVRTRKRPALEHTLNRGELRPDIVDVMLRMAETDGRSIVADPFGGWGAVAAAVAENGRYQKMYTGDINGGCVAHQRKRLRGKRNCIVQKWDALALPLEDKSVDLIITDPPWGEFERIDSRRLYDGFIKESARVLKPDGRLVFLTSARDEARRALGEYGFAFSHTALKIGGKDTFLFRAAFSLSTP